MDWPRIVKLVFWLVVIQMIIMLSSRLVPLLSSTMEGAKLSIRIALSSVLGLGLFRLFYRPTTRAVEGFIDRSARLPIQDTAVVEAIGGYALGLTLPLCSFAVVSTLAARGSGHLFAQKTVAVVAAWTLLWLAVVRSGRVLGVMLRRYREDDLIRDLKRGKRYEREVLETLIEDLALELDPDTVRVRERRFKRLIDYIEEKKLDPEARKRQTLLETSLADVKRRRDEAWYRSRMREDEFHAERWEYKRERIRRRGHNDLRDAVEDELRGFTEGTGGQRRVDGDFDEVGGADEE